MKKFYVLALSALMVAAFAVPSMAKVNLSGAIWATYWAQQEGQVQGEQRNAGGTAWADMNNAVPVPTYGAGAAASKKTFIVGQSMSGNGLQAKTTQGYGFELVADCPVNDWVKAYGDFNVVNAGNLALVEGYINLAFMKEFNIRAGRMQVPFGYERTQRPTVGVEEVFVSEYTQQARGALQRQYDNGVQAYGTVASGMVDYSLYVGNGVISTAADTAAGMVALSQASPDVDDAKQVGVNLCFKPFTGAFVGGSYFAGDYSAWVPGTIFGAANAATTRNDRARFTAYDINAGYEYGNIFSITGEYATTRHDKHSAAFNLGVTASMGELVQDRVNEYILKGIYTGVADWEFGVRYGVVDPKNTEAEIAAQMSVERKLSFAVGYKFARAAFLKAEYSWLDTDVNYLDKISAARAAANSTRANTSQDVDDDIFALSLGLQF